MVRQDYYLTRKDGVSIYRTYSDSGKKIIQVETGMEYDEAFDVYPLKFSYIESENDIEEDKHE